MTDDKVGIHGRGESATNNKSNILSWFKADYLYTHPPVSLPLGVVRKAPTPLSHTYPYIEVNYRLTCFRVDINQREIIEAPKRVSFPPRPTLIEVHYCL